jgi:hypothetical protein
MLYIGAFPNRHLSFTRYLLRKVPFPKGALIN